VTLDELLEVARAATPEAPLRMVVSPCLLGIDVGWDGSSWPEPIVRTLCAHPAVDAAHVCPEDRAFGTPREAMAMHDGDGHGVLDGAARVVTLGGRDVTPAFVEGATAMRALAATHGAVLAVLTDSSPSCGSNVVHRGEVPERAYRRGDGITAAMLRRDGLCIVSQRDHASLHRVLAALDPDHVVDPEASDFVDHPWYREYFG